MKTKRKPNEIALRTAAIKRALQYINDTPELLSLLYDLDLLPEQCVIGMRDWKRMLILAAWHESLQVKNE